MTTKTSALTAPADVTVKVRGVNWTIEAGALDDWDLLEDLADATGASLPSAMRRLLGAAQMNAAKELVRDPDSGRVAASGMSALLTEIFAAVGVAGNR